MMTHGHIFCDIEGDVTDEKARRKMYKSIYENNADVLLHGHAHEPYLHGTQMTPTRYCWIMCPGRIGRKVNYFGTYNQIYGVVQINETGSFEWQFTEVEPCEK
jgi:Predicted phosphoesterase